MADSLKNGEEEIDIGTALGANAGVSTQSFKVYIPNKDRNGKEIGTQRMWVLEAIRLLTELNGGATAMPPVEGAWMGDKAEPVWDSPVVVYSFIRPERFLRSLPRVRELLHRMGRETDQGEIAFEFGEEFFRISNYDAEKKP